MNTIYKFIALAVVLALAACGKEEKKEIRQQDEAKPVAVEPQVQPVEEVKPVEPPKPVQDKHFLAIELRADNLKSGEVLDGYVDLSVPFENPFDSKDIAVEAFISGESNGVSINTPLYFESGNADKSKWRLRYIMPKAGDYKCTISVRGNKKNFFSLEHAFSVAQGEPSKIFKIGKRIYSHFENAAKESFRAIGGDFPIHLDTASQKTLLANMAQSGVNTIRVNIEAPCTAIVAEDTDTAKAGWINTAVFNKLEEVMDAASAQGIKTIVCFSGPLSFSETAYAHSYFAKSKIAPQPKQFFSALPAQQAFNGVLAYAALRLGSRSDLLMWQLIDGIDAFDMGYFDLRTMWLSSANVTLRDADAAASHPILLTAGTSSEMEFLWAGDSCDVLMFDILDVRDFALSVNSHNKFFTKKYKKSVGVSKFGNSPEALALPEPSFIMAHNAIWAGEFTTSPAIPFVNFAEGGEKLKAELKAIKSVVAFEQKFNISKADLELVNLPEAIVLSAPKAAGNSIATTPAFGKVVFGRESSNDIAELILESDGTVTKNTLPIVWNKESVITLRVNGVPNDKCMLSFEIVSIPQDDKFDVQIMLNDDLLKTEKISSDGVKQVRTEGGVKRAYVNKTINIPLARGNQSVGIQLVSAGAASMEVGAIKVDGLGSNMGVASVKPFGMRDKNTGNTFIWFKRAATDTYNFAKFKLYSREVPDLKSFEYIVQLTADSSYRVTWWDTRNNDSIAVGVMKSDANGQLKLRTPPFKFDAACVIEVMQ